MTMAKTFLPAFLLALGALAGSVVGCGGGGKPAEDPSGEEGASEEGTAPKAATPAPSAAASGAVEDPDEKRSQNPQPCTGMAVDLLDALSKAACEVSGSKDAE